MRDKILISSIAVFLLVPSQFASAKVLKGKWSGKSATTLEFLDNNKVKYCYKTKCTTQTYTGDKDSKIKFNWGRSQFTFTKTVDGYDGTFLRVLSAKVKIQ